MASIRVDAIVITCAIGTQLDTIIQIVNTLHWKQVTNANTTKNISRDKERPSEREREIVKCGIVTTNGWKPMDLHLRGKTSILWIEL